MQQGHGLHHMHVRKRLHRSRWKVLKYKLKSFFSGKKDPNYLESYPHPDKFKKYIDKSIYIVGILGPLMTLPQVINIWILKDASGVSMITWGAYFICASLWLCYAILHKDKPLIISQSLFASLDGLVVVSALIY